MALYSGNGSRLVRCDPFDRSAEGTGVFETALEPCDQAGQEWLLLQRRCPELADAYLQAKVDSGTWTLFRKQPSDTVPYETFQVRCPVKVAKALMAAARRLEGDMALEELPEEKVLFQSKKARLVACAPYETLGLTPRCEPSALDALLDIVGSDVRRVVWLVLTVPTEAWRGVDFPYLAAEAGEVTVALVHKPLNRQLKPPVGTVRKLLSGSRSPLELAKVMSRRQMSSTRIWCARPAQCMARAF
jgi:hypothetical protein